MVLPLATESSGVGVRKRGTEEMEEEPARQRARLEHVGNREPEFDICEVFSRARVVKIWPTRRLLFGHRREGTCSQVGHGISDALVINGDYGACFITTSWSISGKSAVHYFQFVAELPEVGDAEGAEGRRPRTLEGGGKSLQAADADQEHVHSGAPC